VKNCKLILKYWYFVTLGRINSVSYEGRELNSIDINCSLDRSYQHTRIDLVALDKSLLAFSACESTDGCRTRPARVRVYKFPVVLLLASWKTCMRVPLGVYLVNHHRSDRLDLARLTAREARIAVRLKLFAARGEAGTNL